MGGFAYFCCWELFYYHVNKPGLVSGGQDFVSQREIVSVEALHNQPLADLPADCSYVSDSRKNRRTTN